MPREQRGLANEMSQGFIVGGARADVGSQEARGGHGNPLQCSCLENPKDRGAWPVTVHRVANGPSWT